MDRDIEFQTWFNSLKREALVDNSIYTLMRSAYRAGFGRGVYAEAISQKLEQENREEV